jgi:peptidoglycan hydrolase-like protein with peptidoglycan-binding domain
MRGAPGARLWLAMTLPPLAAALVLALTAGTRAAPRAPYLVPPSSPASAARPVAATENLPPQMEAAYLRGIQKELRAHGYNAGPVDGRMGPRTAAAIRRYQRDAGLPVDGVASKELLDHLKFVLPKTYAFGQPVLGVVLDVQRELARRDYYLGPQDGLAGPMTRRAVEAFLIDAGLPGTERIDSYLLEQIRQAPEEVRRR